MRELAIRIRVGSGRSAPKLAKSFEKGNNTFQLVAQAPSWIANPTITEEETHDAEPDLLDWSREYAAIPHDGSESSLFSPEMIELVCRKGGPAEIGYVPGQVYVAAQDPATRSDAWTISIASARRVPYGSRQRLSVVCEQYALLEDELARVPEYLVESRAKRY